MSDKEDGAKAPAKASDTPDNPDTYEAEFKKLIAFVEDSLKQVEAGEMPDLSNLDTTVSKLCKDVENADQEIATAVQPLMSEMIAKLDQLAQALNNYQKNIEDDA